LRGRTRSKAIQQVARDGRLLSKLRTRLRPGLFLCLALSCLLIKYFLTHINAARRPTCFYGRVELCLYFAARGFGALLWSSA
jgi:hypothetical protein